MEQNEILEGNKLIAEFMGLKYHNLLKMWLGVGTHDGELIYHKDWNSPMAVVEKIEFDLIYDFNYYEDYLSIKIQDTITGESIVEISKSGNSESESGFSRIRSIYRLIIEFIKYYNSKTQQA